MIGLQHTIGNRAVQRLIQAKTIQTSPDPEESNSESAEDDSSALVEKAADAIEGGGGKAEFHYFPADREWNTSFVLFTDRNVWRFHRYLMDRWFGTSDKASLENTADMAVPPHWVDEFRAKALNVRPKKAGDADSQTSLDEQIADLALNLADSVARETPAQKIRRQFVEGVDKRIGTTVMTQEAIEEERKKEPTEGLTPENFTTCIAFIGQVTSEIAQKPGTKDLLPEGTATLLPHGTHYREMTGVEKQKSLGDAWQACEPGSDARPKPGDILDFVFAENVMHQSGAKKGKLKYGKHWFAHISVLRSIESIGPAESDEAAKEIGEGCTGDSTPLEKWVTVDGGGTTAKVTDRYFCPENCRITNLGGKRFIKGWIDFEKLAQVEIDKKKGS